MKDKVLVVEDDADMAMGIRDNLEFEGFQVVTAGSGEEGLKLAASERPRCILLDIMLPGIDGFETCRRLRKGGVRAPIIMLTARGQEIDKVRGLELGADDYVTKPFGVRELLARIRAALRRYGGGGSRAPREDTIQVGEAKVCLATGAVIREGKENQLGYYESEILRMLHENAGSVVTRQELLSEIWGLENDPTNRSVDNHIVSLRRKIETDSTSPRHLLTVHGFGYKLVP